MANCTPICYPGLNFGHLNITSGLNCLAEGLSSLVKCEDIHGEVPFCRDEFRSKLWYIQALLVLFVIILFTLAIELFFFSAKKTQQCLNGCHSELSEQPLHPDIEIEMVNTVSDCGCDYSVKKRPLYPPREAPPAYMEVPKYLTPVDTPINTPVEVPTYRKTCSQGIRGFGRGRWHFKPNVFTYIHYLLCHFTNEPGRM